MIVGDVDQFLRRAGADDELRPGRDGLFELGSIEDGAGTGNGALNLIRDGTDRLQRGRRAQGDLDRLEASGDQRPRERYRRPRIIDHQDRNHRLQLEDGEKLVRFRAHADRPFKTIE